jgi:O-acetyl-ADP-ribose deacetylase (regulator of RNase III)
MQTGSGIVLPVATGHQKAIRCIAALTVSGGRNSMELIKGDVTEVTDGIILHIVNCQHKMGSGVAKALRDKWPLVYDYYMKDGKGPSMLGKVGFVPVAPGLTVVNGYGQEFYGYDGKRYADPVAIDRILQTCFEFCVEWDLKIAMPKIASGLGGLDWDKEVVPLIEKYETATQDTGKNHL